MTEEIGLEQPVEYTDAERRTIATHEAGHATVAAPRRRRTASSRCCRSSSASDALGLLAHSDIEERFTKTRSEIDRADPDRLGRHGRRGAVLRRGRHRARRATFRRRPPLAAQMVGSLGMAGSLISFDAMDVARRPQRRGQGAVRRRLPASASKRILDAGQGAADRHARRRTAHVVEALRDALLERDELVGEEITAVIDGAPRPAAAGRSRSTSARPKRSPPGRKS